MLDPGLLTQAKEERERLLDAQHEAEKARSDYHHTIRKLNAAGASLREIADELGLSHQRVHQIVEAGAVAEITCDVPPFPYLRSWRRGRGRGGPFEHFAKEAREVIVHAQEESQALGHNYVGTEHLLLGLARRESGLAADALAALGVTHEQVRAAVVEEIGEGKAAKAGPVPFTPRAKKALELSLREAKRRSSMILGPEDLLVALAEEGDGIAAKILARLGASAEAVRAELERRRAA